MRRCLAETGFGRKVETETNVNFGKLAVALGDAEWAATQTVHFVDSVAFECWCAANAIADQKISNTHRHATRFEIDRMTATPWMCCLNLYQNRKRTQRQCLGNQLITSTKVRSPG
jgi:hypothetical protein